MEELSKGYPLHHLIHKPVAGHLETTQLDIFKQVTIDQAVLDDPKTAAESIDRVLFHCLEHKKPVYIEIPRNRVEAEIEIPLPPRFSPAASNPQTLSEALEERREISIAIGILIERHRLSRDAAFEMLRNHARGRRQRIQEVAIELLNSVERLNDLSAVPAKRVQGC